jgi:hypothetical protein
MASPGSTRRGNFEGAFPLLLIGGALLVYAVVLANQELGAHSSHLPLFGLVGGVGAVIAGAGLFSAFSVDPSNSVPAAPTVAPLARRGRGAPNATSRSYRRTPAPVWWEGPGELPRPSGTAAVAVSATAGPPAVTPRAAPTPSSVSAPRSAVDLNPNRKWTNSELLELLSEIEAIAHEHESRFPSRPERPAPKGVPSCCDCHASMVADTSPSCCSECGRGLCVDCALASSLEDGDLRCLECRETSANTAGAAS